MALGGLVLSAAPPAGFCILPPPIQYSRRHVASHRVQYRSTTSQSPPIAPLGIPAYPQARNTLETIRNTFIPSSPTSSTSGSIIRANSMLIPKLSSVPSKLFCCLFPIPAVPIEWHWIQMCACVCFPRIKQSLTSLPNHAIHQMPQSCSPQNYWP